MPIALGLLLTTSLLAPATQSPAQPDTPPPAVQQPRSQGESGTPSTSTDRPHEVGFGGFGGSGGGASFRYFMNERVGVDMNVGWSLPSMGGSRNTTNGSGGGTFRAASSGMFMLTKSHQLADLDVRPYVGGGLNYAVSPSNIQSAAGQLRTSGVGMQAFGGAEFSFASARSIAISAEVAYYRLAVQPVNLITTSGTDFYVLFHYYLK
jgi:outer membrane protein W